VNPHPRKLTLTIYNRGSQQYSDTRKIKLTFWWPTISFFNFFGFLMPFMKIKFTYLVIFYTYVRLFKKINANIIVYEIMALNQTRKVWRPTKRPKWPTGSETLIYVTLLMSLSLFSPHLSILHIISVYPNLFISSLHSRHCLTSCLYLSYFSFSHFLPSLS